MRPSLCSRCGKNVAVIFITKVEGGQTKTEGLCLKCAKELGIKPVNDMLTQLGVGDEDIDKLSEDLTSTLGNSDELASIASMLGAQSADENDHADDGGPSVNRIIKYQLTQYDNDQSQEGNTSHAGSEPGSNGQRCL